MLPKVFDRESSFSYEDEIVENTIDFHSVSCHRNFINAVVTSVKIATGKAVSEIYLKRW